MVVIVYIIHQLEICSESDFNDIDSLCHYFCSCDVDFLILKEIQCLLKLYSCIAMNWNTADWKKLIRKWIFQTILWISLLNRSDSKECELNSGGSPIIDTLLNTRAISCTLYCTTRMFFCIFRWFFGKMSRFEAMSLLMLPGNDNGSFLVRISESDSMGFVISGVCVCCFLTDISEFVTVYILKTAIGDWSSESSILVKTQNKAKHFKIYQTSGQVYVDPSPTFASVLEVVEYYQTHPLSTSDKLKRPCIRVRLSFSVHFSSLSSYACFSSYACLPYSHTLFQFCHMRKWLKEVLHFYKNISFCLFSLDIINISQHQETNFSVFHQTHPDVWL